MDFIYHFCFGSFVFPDTLVYFERILLPLVYIILLLFILPLNDRIMMLDVLKTWLQCYPLA